jgi:hypothetical protein
MEIAPSEVPSISSRTCSGVPWTVTVRATRASVRSGSAFWSTATTSMFCISRRVVGPFRRSGMVRNRSMRAPGVMKPPTEFAALTGRVKARIPSSMRAATVTFSPKPVTLDLRIGSFGSIRRRAVRTAPSSANSSLMSVKPFSGAASAGQRTMRTCLRVSSMPNFRGALATATSTVGRGLTGCSRALAALTSANT